MQSSPQSPHSYSLLQGSRERTQSSDVNEALFNLDRVLHGKFVAYVHGCLHGCLLAVMNRPSFFGVLNPAPVFPLILLQFSIECVTFKAWSVHFVFTHIQD